MNRQKQNYKYIALSLLISVQLFCLPTYVFASDPIDSLENPKSSIDMREDAAFPLEKQMPETIVTAPSDTQSTRSTTAPTAYIEPEDPFKSATTELPELKDPFVKYNRFMFTVNDNILKYIIQPVARKYRAWVDESVRISVKNAYNNARTPEKFVSSLLQGNLGKATRVLGRVVINTTIGIGGLFDVAHNHFHIEDVDEDFGQTLGYHKVPPGPYIVLPLIGPSTARDALGLAVDSFLSPAVMFSPSIAVGMAIPAAEEINRSSLTLEDDKWVKESVVDEYESMRDAYHQYREDLIKK